MAKVLSHVTEVGPTEEVSGTTGQSDSLEHNTQLQDITELSELSLNPEVILSDPDIGNSTETTNSDMSHADESEQKTGHYELPNRSTRGVPPRTYSQDCKG